MLTMVRSNPIWGFSWAGGGPGGLVGGRPRETGYAVSALKREVFRQMPAQPAPVVEAIVAGANGYILKSAAPEAIIDAVRATAAGECVLSSRIAGKLLERIRERDIPVTASAGSAAVAIRAALTERELEIFQRLA